VYIVLDRSIGVDERIVRRSSTTVGYYSPGPSVHPFVVLESHIINISTWHPFLLSGLLTANLFGYCFCRQYQFGRTPVVLPFGHGGACGWMVVVTPRVAVRTDETDAEDVKPRRCHHPTQHDEPVSPCFFFFQIRFETAI
jgi:hypothetical protein